MVYSNSIIHHYIANVNSTGIIHHFNPAVVVKNARPMRCIGFAYAKFKTAYIYICTLPK